MRNRLLVGVFIIIFLVVGAFIVLDFDKQPVVEVEEVSFEEVTAGDSSVPEAVILSESEGRVEGSAEAETPDDQESSEIPPNVEMIEDSIESEDLTPDQINLAVPFTPQAPHANWDLPYQEACEEASAYMVWLYFEGYASGLVDAEVADIALLEVIDYQNKTLGDYLDTTAQETVDFIEGFYGLDAYVVEYPTVDQIKDQIAAGYPVVVPAAGRELGNPNFTGQGPLYHMLVLRGYTDDMWITNDPGTRNGQGYVYEIDVIMNAMGDWNNGNPANGAKVVIFVEPIR